MVSKSFGIYELSKYFLNIIGFVCYDYEIIIMLLVVKKSDNMNI